MMISWAETAPGEWATACKRGCVLMGSDGRWWLYTTRQNGSLVPVKTATGKTQHALTGYAARVRLQGILEQIGDREMAA